MKLQLNSIFKGLVPLSLLIIIISLAVWTRLYTLGSPTVLDYDPWWHYRYAMNILNNNLRVPKWDLLSFYPPGRPVEPFRGWEYTMITFFKIINSLIPQISFTEVAKWAPVIMVGLTTIPAFLLGKFLSNKWAGLATAIFATLTPTFIGVSMAGYCDTDATVVFYFFLSVYSIFLAIKKRSPFYYGFAILVNLIFVFNWGAGWLPLILFTVFIPAFFIFRLLEDMFHQKKLRIDLSKTVREIKPLFISLMIILIVTNVLGYFLGLGHMLRSLVGGLGFTGIVGERLLVNVSVAELQPINILTKGGFLAVVGRAGLLPTLLTLFGLPILVVYKFFKKTKISFSEIFLYTWALITFYLILHGVRFSLLFSCAAAVSAGYVIGNLFSAMKKDVIGATFFGIITLLSLMFVSDALLYADRAGGMQIGQNWIDMLDWLKQNADEDSLIATWWDPGHIIAGYTGLHVHADGAHCGAAACVPYNHNIRIQNMGKIMSTNNEEEAVEILEKYRQLTPEQCQEVKQKFGDKVPDEVCEPASEMYFISSNDLIGKFTWMNYFGGYRAPIKSNADFLANPGVCCASTPKTEPDQISCGEFANQGKGVWIWCPWIFSLSDVRQDEAGNPIYIYDYSGLTIALIQKDNQLVPVYNNRFIINHLTFFPQGQEQTVDLSDLPTNLERIDGLIWIDPSFRSLIYFAPSIKDSIFTRTFFYNGEGLEHFELVYSNSEIRLFRVNF